MRVLHLANGNMYGGIETFLVTLARLERSSAALENHFLLSHRGRLSAELEAAGAEPRYVEGVRLRHPWSVLRARHECRARVRQLKPDVVLAHGPWTYVVFAQGLPAEPPVILFQHGVAQRDVLHLLAARSPPLGIVAASAQSASTASIVFPGVDVHVCTLPVLLRLPLRPREEVRSTFGVADETVILNVGRLEPGKGHALLFEALGHLKSKKWRLWVAGGWSRPLEGRLRQDLEAQAGARGIRGRVTFLGERTDIPELMNAADIFCHPSTTQEGFGIAIIEAMAAGLPLVVTHGAAIADPVGPEIGRRVNPVARDVAAALDELLADEGKRHRLGIGASSRFKERFAPVPALERIRDTLAGLAAVNERPRGEWA